MAVTQSLDDQMTGVAPIHTLAALDGEALPRTWF
jgi:hypothetical protein